MSFTEYLVTGLFSVVLLVLIAATYREKRAAARRTEQGNRNFSLHVTALRNEAKATRKHYRVAS